jgi:hypothetical protein
MLDGRHRTLSIPWATRRRFGGRSWQEDIMVGEKKTRTFGRAAILAICLSAFGPSVVGVASADPFATASVNFEQNATDGDNEVVFQVKAGKEGLAELAIVAPNGRKVVAFAAPDAVTLGMRQFRFESPEPEDIASLKAAYPEGEYVFSGKTFSGASFSGKSTLSHRLPATTAIVSPAAEARNVAAANLQVTWRPVAGLAAYIVELKDDESGSSLVVQLPASATSFAVPGGFLAPGRKYKLAVGTVGREGNISFVETSFTTGK